MQQGIADLKTVVQRRVILVSFLVNLDVAGKDADGIFEHIIILALLCGAGDG
jgi:hypothetical protein